MATDGENAKINAKILRLNSVYKKAIDVASNSLNNADLDECFQGLKSQYGNVLPKLFMNMIAKSQVNIEASYKDACIRWDLEKCMRSYEVQPFSSSSAAESEEMDLTDMASAEDPLSPSVLLELKRAEAQGLREAIQLMEAEMVKMRETTGFLRDRINNEMVAVAEEGHKISSSISS